MASFFKFNPSSRPVQIQIASPTTAVSTTSHPPTSGASSATVGKKSDGVGSTVALENIPGALTEEYKNKRVAIVNINETITKEFSQKIAHQINEAANPAVTKLAMHKFNTDFTSAASSENPIIFITIDSNGGSIYESLPILEAMRRAKACGCIVITVINAIAFSCAFAIFASGSDGYRFVNFQAKMLVHQPASKVPKEHKLPDSNHSYSYEYSPFHPVPPHSHGNSNSNDSGNDSGSEDQKHLDHLQEEVLAALIGAIPSDELKTEFLDNAAENSHKNWYLYAQDALYYGIANHATVPDFVHHVTYTPMLHLGGGKTLAL